MLPIDDGIITRGAVIERLAGYILLNYTIYCLTTFPYAYSYQ